MLGEPLGTSESDLACFYRPLRGVPSSHSNCNEKFYTCKSPGRGLLHTGNTQSEIEPSSAAFHGGVWVLVVGLEVSALARMRGSFGGPWPLVRPPPLLLLVQMPWQSLSQSLRPAICTAIGYHGNRRRCGPAACGPVCLQTHNAPRAFVVGLQNQQCSRLALYPSMEIKSLNNDGRSRLMVFLH